MEGEAFLRRVIHPEDLPVLLEHATFWREARDPLPESRRLDVRVRNAAGEWRHFMIRGRAFDLAHDGNALRLICSAQDVTEQVRAESERHRLEQRFRAVVDGSPFGMHFYRLADDGRLVFDGANPAADRILGLDHAALAGRTIDEAFPALAGSEVTAAYARIAREGGDFQRREIAYRDERIDGVFEVWAFRPSPGSVVAVFIDVTERARLEARERAMLEELEARVSQRTAELSEAVDRLTREAERRAASEAALRASEEKYRALVEGTNDVILRVDREGTVVYASPQLARYGFDVGRIVGANALSLIVEEDRERVTAEFERTLATGEEFPSRFRIDTPAFGRRWFEDHSRALRDGAGAVTGITGVLRDVTDRLREEEERRAFEGRVLQAQKLESLGVLAGGIAHDFNNLLTAILGHASLARAARGNGEVLTRHLEAIEGAAKRSAELVRQILAYAGRGAVEFVAVDLNETLLEMRSLLESSVSKKTSLRLDLAPDTPPVTGDATQLRQIAMNLVVNASEALDGRAGEIRIATRRIDGRPPAIAGPADFGDPDPGPLALLEVTDTGIGMPPGIAARIFEPFFSTKFIGRGLGMSAVHGIVRRHHGAIRIESAPGRGSCFRIYLPAATGTTPAAAAEVPATSRREPPPRGTILIVDDEASVREVAREALVALGLDIVEAADGEEAVRVFRADPCRFRGVLLDLSMPRMDGTETFRALRAIDPAVRVVLMSGYGAEAMESALSGAPRAGFLEKPFTLEALEAVFRIFDDRDDASTPV